MSFRCVSAFIYADKVYSGGTLVADSDPILKTHGDYFKRIEESVSPARTETAAADTPRVLQPKPDVDAVEDPRPRAKRPRTPRK